MAAVVIAFSRQKFPLGEIVITANAQNRLDHVEIEQGLTRHARR